MASPQAIAATARSGHAVIGWKLAADEREALLKRFPARYPNLVADHVTLSAKVASDTALPDEVDAKIVGCADDDCGVQALVVAIEGSTDRPGGGIYHITWSLAEGRRPKESNDVLAKQTWTPLAEPVPIHIKGARVG